MLLGLVLLATITTAVPIRSAHPPTFYTFAGADDGAAPVGAADLGRSVLSARGHRRRAPMSAI